MKASFRKAALALGCLGILGSAHGQEAGGGPLNFSIMLTLAPKSTATMGFVVGPAAAGAPKTYYLLRAVGPSLSEFGVSNAVEEPVLTLYNSAGQNITPTAYAGTIDWSATFTQVGAFPLLSDSSAYTGPTDAYFIVSLAPGVYSAQVSDASGAGGETLLEAYVSPAPILTGFD